MNHDARTGMFLRRHRVANLAGALLVASFSFTPGARADILPSILGMKPQPVVVRTTGDPITDPVTVFVKRMAQQCGIHNCVNFCIAGAAGRVGGPAPISLMLPAVSAAEVRSLSGFFADTVAYTRGMCAGSGSRLGDPQFTFTLRLLRDNGPAERRLLHLENYARALRCDRGDYGTEGEQRLQQVQAGILEEAAALASTDYEKFLARRVAEQFVDGRPDYRETQRLVGGRDYALLWRHVKQQEIDWSQPNSVMASVIPAVDPTQPEPPRVQPSIPAITTESGQRVTSGRGLQPVAVDDTRPAKYAYPSVVLRSYIPPPVLCKPDLRGPCSLDRRDEKGKTHLYRAMEAGDAADAWTLLLAGADPEVEPYPGGGTALDLLMEKGPARFGLRSARWLLDAFKANGRATVHPRYEIWRSSSGPAEESGEAGEFFVATRETIKAMPLRKIVEAVCPTNSASAR